MATGTPTTQALATPLRFRRNAGRLTPGQLTALRTAFEAFYGISDDRGYARWAGIHGLPLPIGCRNAHGTPYFLPWHRAYLYFFERALRDAERNALRREPSAMVAWWDWRTPAGRQGRIPRSFDAAEADGEPNPLRSAAVGRRALDEGRQRGVEVAAETERRPSLETSLPLPTSDEVETLLSERDFGTFTDRLDTIHGGVHMWVGGHMTEIDFAAFDPIFWAHHAMVDRLWRMWQLRHGRPGPPSSIFDDALPPFRMTVRQTLSVTALGYDYAGASASAAAA